MFSIRSSRAGPWGREKLLKGRQDEEDHERSETFQLVSPLVLRPLGHHEHRGYTCILGRSDRLHWRTYGRCPHPLGRTEELPALGWQFPRQSKGLDRQVVTAFQPHVEPCLPSSRLPAGLSPKEKLRGPPDPAHRSQDWSSLGPHACTCEYVLLGGGLHDPVLTNTYWFRFIENFLPEPFAHEESTDDECPCMPLSFPLRNTFWGPFYWFSDRGKIVEVVRDWIVPIPPKHIYPSPKPTEPVTVTLLGKTSLHVKLNYESQGKIIPDLGWALSPMASVLIRERQENIWPTETQERSCVQMKAETGEVQSQAKDTWSPQKLGGWVGSPPGGSREIGSFWHPELRDNTLLLF